MVIADAPAQSSTSVKPYQPQDSQDSWHQCYAYESGYGGAKYGGKSLALLAEAIRYIDHPGYRGVLFRVDYPRLSELMDRAQQRYPSIGGHWRGDSHTWAFPSGAQVLFRHCSTEDAKYAYNGHEYQFMGFDQAEEFSLSRYTYLLAQNRSGIPELQPFARSTFNPGGIGHGWVKQRFVEHGTTTCKPWMAYNDEGKPTGTRCFHFASIDDNPIGDQSDPSYRRRLEGLPAAERRALLHGDWNVFAGQVFGEWDPAVHVIEHFAVPRDWPRIRGYDYGWTDPSVMLWLARNPATGQLVVYRELTVTETTVSQQASMIRELTAGEHIHASLADPSIWATSQTAHGAGTSIAQEFALAGVGFVPANNARLAGWARLHELLATHDPQGRRQAPGLVVMRNCREVIRTLPELVYDSHNVNDVDTHGDDHWCFVAGTRVLTQRGDVAIETVHVGDEAWTRRGWRQVIESSMTEHDAEVITVMLSDGTELTGTGNHPVWVHSDGMTRMDRLRYGMMVEQWTPSSSGMPRRVSAPAHVVGSRIVGYAPVYNLTVEDEHEYVANGVLVSNCDALRYACMGTRQATVQATQPRRQMRWVP